MITPTSKYPATRLLLTVCTASLFVTTLLTAPTAQAQGLGGFLNKAKEKLNQATDAAKQKVNQTAGSATQTTGSPSGQQEPTTNSGLLTAAQNERDTRAMVDDKTPVVLGQFGGLSYSYRRLIQLEKYPIKFTWDQTAIERSTEYRLELGSSIEDLSGDLVNTLNANHGIYLREPLSKVKEIHFIKSTPEQDRLQKEDRTGEPGRNNGYFFSFDPVTGVLTAALGDHVTSVHMEKNGGLAKWVMKHLTVDQPADGTSIQPAGQATLIRSGPFADQEPAEPPYNNRYYQKLYARAMFEYDGAYPSSGTKSYRQLTQKEKFPTRFTWDQQAVERAIENRSWMVGYAFQVAEDLVNSLEGNNGERIYLREPLSKIKEVHFTKATREMERLRIADQFGDFGREKGWSFAFDPPTGVLTVSIAENAVSLATGSSGLGDLGKWIIKNVKVDQPAGTNTAIDIPTSALPYSQQREPNAPPVMNSSTQDKYARMLLAFDGPQPIKTKSYYQLTQTQKVPISFTWDQAALERATETQTWLFEFVKGASGDLVGGLEGSTATQLRGLLGRVKAIHFTKSRPAQDQLRLKDPTGEPGRKEGWFFAFDPATGVLTTAIGQQPGSLFNSKAGGLATWIIKYVK